MFYQTGQLGTRFSQLGQIVLGSPPPPFVNVNQFVLEVIYSISGPTTHVSDVVSVTPAIGVATSAFPVTEALTIHVTETISSYSIGQHFLTKIQTVSIDAAATANVDRFARVSVNQFVLELIYRKAPVFTIAQNVTVAETIVSRSNVNRETNSDSISVNETITPVVQTATGRIVNMRVSDSVGVANTYFSRNSVVRMTVTDAIAAAVPSSGRDSTRRATRADTINIAAITGARTGAVSLLVHGFVHLSERLGSNFTGITVTDRITVGSIPFGASGTVRLNVTDIIHFYQYSPRPAQAYVSPVSIAVIDAILISGSIEASTPNVSVLDFVAVFDGLHPNYLAAHFNDTIKVTTALPGGNSNRNVAIVDAISVKDTIVSRISPVSILIADSLSVSTEAYGTGPIHLVGFRHTLNVFCYIDFMILRTMPVADTVHVRGDTTTFGPKRITRIDSITVSNQYIERGPKYASITDAVSIRARNPLLWQRLHDTIAVSDTVTRVFTESIQDNIHATPTLTRHSIVNKRIYAEIDVTSAIQRGVLFTVNIADTMIIPENTYLLSTGFGPPILLPVGTGTLVSQYVTISGASGIIILPAALLGDKANNVASITVQRSMNAKYITLVKSSIRQKLAMSFRLSLQKGLELRNFIIENISNPLTLVNWNGDSWYGYLMDNPFEQTFAGRSAPTEGEFTNVTLNFEGVKIS